MATGGRVQFLQIGEGAQITDLNQQIEELARLGLPHGRQGQGVKTRP